MKKLDFNVGLERFEVAPNTHQCIEESHCIFVLTGVFRVYIGKAGLVTMLTASF